MTTIGVVPAYGRDYKSRKEVRAAIDAGQDFVVSDFLDPHEGKPLNAPQARGVGIESFRVRYANRCKQGVFPLYPATKTGALR